MSGAASCESCRYWHRDQFGRAQGGYHCDGSYSQCRRHAPQYKPSPTGSDFAGSAIWPFTAKWDWCGDHLESSKPELKEVA